MLNLQTFQSETSNENKLFIYLEKSKQSWAKTKFLCTK